MENYSYNSSYPDSGDSSPRSREIEFDNPPPWEDSQSNQPPPNHKIKFMCSYGGKIHPRPNDNQLSYMGGETKILAVDRNIKFGTLFSKLIAMCDSENISFKYQLPGEDLDALISVTNDEDLEHMMHEYGRLYKAFPKPARLRIFIFQTLNQSLNSSTRSFGSDEVKSEKERFVEALNSASVMTAPPQSVASPAAPQTPPLANNVDFLFGLEKANEMAAQPPAQQTMVGRIPDVEDLVVVPGLGERFSGLDPIQKHIQDLHRLRLEEQQGIHRKKNDDHLAGDFLEGDYYKPPEKISQVVVQGGVPYWADKQATGGFYSAGTVNSEQPVYMIPHPSSEYHAPMMRQMTGAPTQGYYTVQRIPPEVYRDNQQQQQMYNMIPQAAAAGYTEGFGMVRQANAGGAGLVTEAGYAQVAYDGGSGRQVMYVATGGVMVAPAQMQTTAQYQAMAGGVGVDLRQAGPMNPEAVGKGVAKVTQNSV